MTAPSTADGSISNSIQFDVDRPDPNEEFDQDDGFVLKAAARLVATASKETRTE